MQNFIESIIGGVAFVCIIAYVWFHKDDNYDDRI